MRIREGTASDGAECAAIYAPYVRDTAVSFESEPPTAAEMARRIDAALTTHAWLVIEDSGRVVGYAYGSRFRARDAYRRSCEVSAYIERAHQGRGAGHALYAELLARLAARGYRTAVAGYTLPNPRSEGLHRALEFEPVGVYRSIGFKFGLYHDVAWVQRMLSASS